MVWVCHLIDLDEFIKFEIHSLYFICAIIYILSMNQWHIVLNGRKKTDENAR